MPMKFLIPSLIALIVLCAFISPVEAWDSGSIYPVVIPTVPEAPSPLPTFAPINGSGTISSWVDLNNETFDLWTMLNSLISPYTAILGSWFFVIIYAVYIFAVYARTGGIASVGISLGITLPLWYMMFPQSTWYCPVAIFVLAVTATFYRIFKKR